MEDANPSLICSMAIITPVKQVLGKVPEATGGSKNYFSVLMDKQKRSETSEVRNHTQPPTRSPRGVTVRQNKRSLGTRGTMRSSWGYQFFTHRPPNSRFSVNRTWGGECCEDPKCGWHECSTKQHWVAPPKSHIRLDRRAAQKRIRPSNNKRPNFSPFCELCELAYKRPRPL